MTQTKTYTPYFGTFKALNTALDVTKGLNLPDSAQSNGI